MPSIECCELSTVFIRLLLDFFFNIRPKDCRSFMPEMPAIDRFDPESRRHGTSFDKIFTRAYGLSSESFKNGLVVILLIELHIFKEIGRFKLGSILAKRS